METIREFLAQKRIAVVGVSRNPRDYSTLVFRELRTRGYDAVPVNPNAAEIESVRCYARVQDVSPAPDAALILLPPAALQSAVAECIEAGVRRIWLRRKDAGALELCRAQGIKAVAGHCPMMFLPDAMWIHRFHAWVLRLAGSYPA